MLFYSPKNIYVYKIQNNIILEYKIKLPFYQDYSSFTFASFNEGVDSKSYYKVYQSFANGFLSVLMHDIDTPQIKFVITFSISETQHNSLVMGYNATDFYQQLSI